MKEWDAFLKTLGNELGKEAIEKWMPKLVHFDAANIYLQPSDSFQISWFDEHVRPKLKTLVNQNYRQIKVHLNIPQKEKKEKPKEDIFSIIQDSLDPEMTLEHFIPSEKNLVAHKILSEDSPFNPIYLYGPQGGGKTHLLMAAASRFQSEGKRIFYVKAETFTDHVVQAIRLAEMQQFRKVYRDIDVLLVDDIHVFSKKNATQEEFFHTFNTLHTMGKPIILSANCSPSKLKEIEPRLISRFEWGISLEVEKSDPEKILESKANLWRFDLNSSLKTWLLETFQTDSILALQALVFRLRGTPSVENAKIALKDLIEKQKQKQITPELIIKQVAAHHGVTSEDLLGKSQMKNIALPRKIAMYYCRSKLKLPFQSIGEIFSRDHSTVMSSCKQIQKKIDVNEIDPLKFTTQ